MYYVREFNVLPRCYILYNMYMHRKHLFEVSLTACSVRLKKKNPLIACSVYRFLAKTVCSCVTIDSALERINILIVFRFASV